MPCTVFRTDPHTFLWEPPYDPAADEHGYLTFICEDPQADAWEVTFPRYRVGYGGWTPSRRLNLSVAGIAERAVAEQIRDHILRTHRHIRELWAEVYDEGRAPYEDFPAGAAFYFTAGARAGKKGFIVIRHRDSAGIQMDDEHLPGGLTYDLDLMSLTPPPSRPIRHSMNWLKG